MTLAPRVPGVLLVLAAATLWGTSGTAQAFAPAGATPAVVGAVRIVLGGIILFAVALAQRALPPLTEWWRVELPIIVLSQALYQVLFFGAVARTGVAVGTVVGIGSSPVIAGALALVVLRERPDPGWGVATALAVSGSALLVAGAAGSASVSRLDAVGLAFALGAGASYAVYVLATKRLLSDGWRPDAAAGIAFLLGGLLLVPVLVAGDTTWMTTPRGIGVVLHLGFITAGLAYVLFTRGLLTVRAGTAVTLTLAEPVTAAALGVLVLREALTPMDVVGGALVLAGLVYLASRARRQPS